MSEIERTPLANFEYRAKTGELLTTGRTLRDRIISILGPDEDGCECQTCINNWEEHG